MFGLCRFYELTGVCAFAVFRVAVGEGGMAGTEAEQGGWRQAPDTAASQTLHPTTLCLHDHLPPSSPSTPPTVHPCRIHVPSPGRHPEHVTVVGYDFKESRFRDLHRAALLFPAARFSYVGTPALSPGAVTGETAVSVAFRQDPYGCHGELGTKRAQRDPFVQGGYAPDRCPAMADLLDWCGPSPYPGTSLPWQTDDGMQGT